MELRSALRLLRERWRLVVAVTLLALVATGVLTWRQTPQYTAAVTLFVSAGANPGDPAAAYEAALLSQQQVKSYGELMRSQRVLAVVVDRLGLRLTPGGLAEKVTAAQVADTALLTATVTDPSPAQAKRIADTLGDEFVRLVPSLSSTADGQRAAIQVSVVSSAELPTSPVSPRPVRNLVVGLVVGLLAGFGLAVARRSLDTTIKTAEQLAQLSDAPSLGSIAFDASTSKKPLISVLTNSPRAEAYRKLCTNLRFVDVDRSNKVILVTSAVANEGKSITACNLAIALAETQKRVIVIDADLRHPAATGYLGLPNGVGLSNVLVGDVPLDQATQVWGGRLFSVLASGPVPPNPSAMLGSRQMRGLLAFLRERYDVVLVDAPPVLPVADAAAVASACDGVLLVLRHGKTRQEQVRTMFDMLRNVEVPILGTVFNFAPSIKEDWYYAAPDGPADQATDPRRGAAPVPARPREPMSR